MRVSINACFVFLNPGFFPSLVIRNPEFGVWMSPGLFFILSGFLVPSKFYQVAQHSRCRDLTLNESDAYLIRFKL